VLSHSNWASIYLRKGWWYPCIEFAERELLSARNQDPKRKAVLMSEKPSKHELTILQWLAVAGVAGIVLTLLLNYLRG
jgi:hypothetical protein